MNRIQRSVLVLSYLVMLPLQAQDACEPDYSAPITTLNNLQINSSMSNNQYNTIMTLGQPFIGTATNYSQNSSALGFWGFYLKEPRPPLVRASDGDFQNMILVEWTLEDDRTGAPVSDNNLTLYRNGYVLTQLPVVQTQYQDFNVFPGEYYSYGVTSGNDMGDSYPDNDVGFLNPNGVITGHVETRSGNPVLDTKIMLTPNTGQSALFDGASYIYFFDDSTASNRLFSGFTGNYTIETWFRSITTSRQTLFAAVDSATADHYILVELDNDGKIHWQHTPPGGGSSQITTVNSYTGDSDWHHLAAVFENNAMTLYVDGELAGASSASGPINDTAEIILGKSDPRTSQYFFNGRLDEFRIWNIARSWEDILKLSDITMSGNETGLAAYWKFDEAEGTKIFDLTSNNIDGEVCGVERNNLTAPVYVGALTDTTGNYMISGIYYSDRTTFTATPSKITSIGRSLILDGVSSFIDFNNERLDLTGSYTFEGWFKTPAGVQGTLFAGVDPADGSAQLAIEMLAGGQIRASQFSDQLQSPDSYNDNQWHHFAVTGDSTTLNLYVDGINQGSTPVTTPVSALSAFVFGRQAPDVSAGYFTGKIDEFRYWNYARTGAQIGGSMNLPLAGDEDGLAGYWKMNEGSGSLIGDASGNFLSGTAHLVYWSQDIPLNEVFEHSFDPESRQVTLNLSNTSVDMVNFNDISVIPVSGYVRYANTSCFQEGVEMLLNGESFPVPNFTDADGKFIVELEPGSSGDQLSCRYEDHNFSPAFIELPLISAPITALYFDDMVTHNVNGIVAGGLCQYPITPSQGNIQVFLSSVNGCIQETVIPDTTTGLWSIQNVPPLIYNLSIDHPDPSVDSYFSGDTLSLTQSDRSYNFIYRSNPVVTLSGMPTDSCGLKIMNQFDDYPLTTDIFEAYINYSTGDTNTCPIDTGFVEIISDLGSSVIDTTVSFINGSLDFTVTAGMPNILAGGEHPYQKSIQIIATDNLNRQAATTDWTYVIGQRPRQTAYTTTTPQVPLMIIHRPPGDGSSSSWASGQSFSNAVSFSLASSSSLNAWVKAHLGVDIETQTGLGFSVGLNINATLDLSTSTTVTTSNLSQLEQLWSYSTTETLSTTGGSDVYTGAAINLKYGLTDVLYIDQNCQVQDSVTIYIVPQGFETYYYYSETQILGVIIPNLLLIGDTTSADMWQSYIDQNHSNMAAATFQQNISFDAGAQYDYETTYEVTETNSTTIEIELVEEVATVAGLEINGVGLEGGVTVNMAIKTGVSRTTSQTISNTFSFSLSDDDTGDSYTVDILTDPVYGSPVFYTQSGFSSCPWVSNTVPRDGPSLNVTPFTQVDIPPDESAVFTLSIGNTSQTDEDREYALYVIQGSNPDGAVVAVNGVIIQNSLNFFVPAGEVQETIMTVDRGPDAYIYNDLELQLVPPCEYEIWQAGWPLLLADTISVSVEYQIPCSESHIAVPEDGWLVTGDSGSDTLWVTVDGYDRNDPNLLRVDLQYRQNINRGDSSDGSNGNNWTTYALPPSDQGRTLALQKGLNSPSNHDPNHTVLRFDEVSPVDTLQTDRVGDWFNTASITKDELIDDYVLLPFNISPNIIIDGEYQLRAVAVCDAGLAPGASNVVSGIIDRQPPEVLGNPMPVNGILGPDDDISISFNEDIECGALSPGAGDLVLTNTVTGNPIDFTFTCGGNTIVINPNIENSFIENQTLRASVGPVEDLYGNRSQDAITWEFYVNRNALSWVGNAINNVVIWVEDSFETTRTLVNVRGSNASYEITNIPDWLTVFPTGGILPPGGAETITFVLNQDPGAGHYSQTVYAHGTLGDEPMPVDIRVLCHPPAWEFSPLDFEYSMNIIADLVINGTPSDDSYDIVAVFVGNELRGVQNVQFVPELENMSIHPYQVYLTIFSNQLDGENLEFQVWDASGCSLMGQILESYNFTANDILGTPTQPVTISATNEVIQSVTFNPGWSWFSFNVIPPDMGINSLLSTLSPAIDDQIKGQDSYSQYAGSYGWLGTLSALDPTSMYMMQLSYIDTMRVTGSPVDLEAESINISAGWNWIGYLPQMSYSVDDALGSLISFTGDLIKSNQTFSMYLEGVGWLGNLLYLNPKNGYKLYSQNSGTLQYPLPGEILPLVVPPENSMPVTQSNSQNWLVNPGDFEKSMNMVLQISNPSGDEDNPEALLGAFSNMQCRGIVNPVYIPELEKSLYFLTVFGDAEDEQINLRFYSPNQGKPVDLNGQFSFVSNGILGSPDEPIFFSSAGGGEPLIPTTFELSQNYPNPFNPATTIEYSLPVEAAVTLQIYNLHGEIITTLVDAIQPPGFYQVLWDGSDQYGSPLPSGIYLYNLAAGDFRAHRKLALIK